MKRQTIRPTMILLALGLGAAAWLPAQAAPQASQGAIKPAKIYHDYCSVCHGDRGDGRSRAQNSLIPPPRDFTTPEAATLLNRQRMIDAVANGRSGTAMVGWKSQLTPKEIEAVVDYVRDTFMPAHASADSNRGRQVYSRNCAVCHGEQGDGRSRAQNSLHPPPRDFTSAAARSTLSRERMIASVTYGRPDTAMAGFKSQLSTRDIHAVVDYIRNGFMRDDGRDDISGVRNAARHPSAMAADAARQAAQAAAPAPAAGAKAAVLADMKAPMPDRLKGDAVKGAAFYMSNCATCHGTTGDGRGPRAYFINPKPRNFLHTASREQFNRPAIYHAVANGKLGTEMPAWNKVLEPQEIADVSEFVFQRFIQPGAGTAQAKASR